MSANNIGLSHITSKDVLNYRNSITDAGKTARTANLSIKVVGAAFNAAVRQHLIETNPATALESLPVKAEQKGTFTRAQVAKLVRAADGDWRGTILLGYYTRFVSENHSTHARTRSTSANNIGPRMVRALDRTIKRKRARTERR
jgi:site-specific recombinase XerD